jgi:uncharacterized coiled-coil protein SlyX
MNDETQERIETKIAFLERAHAELSDVLLRQQREIQALGARLERLTERLEASRVDELPRSPEDERPPHY